MEDMKLEKTLEVIYEHAYESMSKECRNDCPLLRCIGDMLVGIKSSNNDRISLELGIRWEGEWRCPGWK